MSNTKTKPETKQAPKPETKPVDDTNLWLEAMGEDYEQGYVQDEVYTRDNEIKVSKDVTTKALNVFLYEDVEEPSKESYEEVIPQSFTELDVAILSYKRNNTRFDGNKVVCGAISNIDGKWLANQKSLVGTNNQGEEILCNNCRYNPWSENPEKANTPYASQCRTGCYFIYLYAPSLGKVLRLTTSPSTSKLFTEALKEITNLRKADKEKDGNPHFNAEYVVKLTASKMENKDKSNTWLGVNYTITGEKWEPEKVTEIAEGIKGVKDRISSSPVSKAIPQISQVSQASATIDGQAISVEIVGTETLDEDELPFL